MYLSLQTLVFLLYFRTSYLLRFPQSIRLQWNEFEERGVTKCICESGVRPEYVQRMIDHSEYTNDPCFKCYVKCLIVESGIINDNVNDTINAMVLHAANVTIAIAEECLNLYRNTQDPCQKAYDTGLCLMDKLSV